MVEEPLLRWFAYEHLLEPGRSVAQTFATLAQVVVAMIPAGPERTVALRHLLEARDAAVRAATHPGG